MKKTIKRLIKSVLLYHVIMNWFTHQKQIRQLHKWERNGKPLPLPELLKQEVLRDYIQKYNLKIMVETGTFFGDMVEALKKSVIKIYSIELSEYIAFEAQQRFKRSPNVVILQGDSGEVIERVIDEIKLPTLFWLDGHYSGGITAKGKNETPIFTELKHIFNAPDLGHVILIDDARAFGKLPDYPTLDALESFIHAQRSHLAITVQDDIIRVTPT